MVKVKIVNVEELIEMHENFNIVEVHPYKWIEEKNAKYVKLWMVRYRVKEYV